MLNITYKNQVKQVPVGTKLIDFLDETEKTNYSLSSRITN